MTQSSMWIALTVCLLLGGAGSARAVGLGGYVEAGGGSGNFEFDESDDFDVDAESFGVGALLETEPFGPKVFSYRMSVGAETLDLEDDDGVTLEMRGWVFDNTFGFAFVHQYDMRVWAGPTVRLAYYEGDTGNDFDDVDANLWAFAVGASIGANFRLSPLVGLGVEAGFRVAAYGGDSEWGRHDYDEDLWGTTTTGFVRASLLFDLH